MRILLACVFLLAGLQSAALLTAATLERNALRLIEGGGGFVSMREQLAFAQRLDKRHIGVNRLMSNLEADPERRESFIREMIENEPYRAEGWLQLLRFKLSRAQIDDELISVLETLATIAPFEPRVQEVVIQQGLHYWLEISPTARRAVVDTAARAMLSDATYRKTERRALVTSGGLLPLVCVVEPKAHGCIIASE
ncbi:MAG: hypothetical protein JJ934_03455 [Pseudomonadales bacterium]|nr:hypothetical protein [Pseudomonadales bacterium]MBO6704109.1 hypothetical protein [Pseudomonadales bacterium]MBO7006333.1 hypothetical protein [Pseudomonadales bacterium]